jgi:putative transposase
LEVSNVEQEAATQKHAQQIMDFRQSLVAELANPFLDYGQIKKLIGEKSALRYEMPWSSKATISPGTIRKWLEAYRHSGKEGLRPKGRSDIGQSRVVTPEEQQIFLDYLRSNPRLTATSAWKKLCDEGKLMGPIATSSLSRLVRSNGLEREARLHDQVQEMSLKFDFFYPLECVQADCLHGPLIPDGKGGRGKAILIAFIDDSTRRIVYAEFTQSEQSLAFEKGIRHILSSQGKIVKLYVDNGSTFVSTQTQRILDILQIHLIHSTPHRPQGRGKIERFFRTVRDGFLRPLDVQSITGFEDMNLRFRTWLETEYHRSGHRGLPNHQTPLEAWLEKAHHLKTMNPLTDLDTVFFHECLRRVAKDNTVTMNNRLYEVPPILCGKKVTLRYNPQQSSAKVQAWFDGKDYGACRQVDSYANTRVKRSQNVKGAVQDSSSTQAGHIQAGLAASSFRTGTL